MEPDGSLGVTNYSSGVYIPGFGPPRNYFVRNDDLAVGGNPAFSPFLDPNGKTNPDANENGWKDTIKMLPGTVTRLRSAGRPSTSPSVRCDPETTSTFSILRVDLDTRRTATCWTTRTTR
jgi:hypothetical protein